MAIKNLRSLRRRIKFLGNFQKITHSISLISVIRFQKSYQIISKILLNAFYFLEILNNLFKKYPNLSKTKMFQKNNGDKTLVIIIASDRGLAGSFDQLIFKKTNEFLNSFSQKENLILIGIGKKTKYYLQKLGLEFYLFDNFENFLPTSLASELLNYINFLLKSSKINKIFIIRPNLTSGGFLVECLKVYPFDFYVINNLINKILPDMKQWKNLKVEEINLIEEYIFEPSVEEIIRVLFKNIFYLLIYVIILEAQASLEFTRTITMRKANENAKELKEKEILNYNKLRQQKITQELLDIKR
jgi:F-type H+-transporting ATPase subunit gamma